MSQQIATIEINLKSETILGGDGEIKGTVDIDIQIDEHGLPYFSARTLKGVLRKQATWFVNCLPDEKRTEYEQALFHLFGRADENDQHHSNYDAVRFGNAKLSQSLYELIETKKYAPREVMNAITTVRTMTSINDNTGTAEVGSLRKARIIYSGYTFVAPIYVNRELSNIEKELLMIATKLLRHIGLMRNRGKGEVACTLYWEDPKAEKTAIVANNRAANYLYITIDVEEPLKINDVLKTSDSTKALPYIPGRVLRGALIRAYLQDRNINPNDLTTEDLFDSEKIQFWNGYLLINGKRSIPFPQHLFEAKASSKANIVKKRIYNSFDKADFNSIKDESPVRINYDMMLFEKNQIVATNVDITSSLHINLHHHDQKQKNALMYRYEAIAPKQQFQSIVKTTTTNDFIQWLAEKDDYIWLGGARNSGYGRCRISVTLDSVNNEVPNFEESYSDELYIIATSDWIIYDEQGQLISSLNEKWLSEQLGATVKLTDQVVNNQITGGYISNWKAYQPMIRSVRGGSVFHYKIIDGKVDEVKLNQLIERGVGSRTNEGYGRLIALPKWDYINIVKTTPTNVHKHEARRLKRADIEKEELNQLQQSLWNVRTENEMLDEVNRWYALNGPKKLSKINNTQWSKLLEVTNQLLQTNTSLKEVYLSTWQQFWSDVKKRSENKLKLNYEIIHISVNEQKKLSLEDFILTELYERNWVHYSGNKDKSLYWSLKALQLFIRKILRQLNEDGGEPNHDPYTNY